MFLDVDGTLLELADTPHGVVVPPGTVPLLERLAHGLDGALALVSGRAIADLDALFAPSRFAAAGLHGLEHRTAGGLLVPDERDRRALDAVRPALRTFAAGAPGVIVEDKGPNIAVHYRLAPERADEIHALLNRLRDQLGAGFEVLAGKMIGELRPVGTDKGVAVRTFMAEAPFRGRRPVFVGDDVTDEAAFKAVNTLSGVSVRVGATERTAAQWTAPNVGAVHDWLAAFAKEFGAA